MPASPRPRWTRTRTLKSYERLIAPFDGQVTARFADPGALVQNATTSQTAAQPVVTVSDDTRLRIDAYVQQDVAPFVHAGDIAQIVDAANSGRSDHRQDHPRFRPARSTHPHHAGGSGAGQQGQVSFWAAALPI